MTKKLDVGTIRFVRSVVRVAGVLTHDSYWKIWTGKRWIGRAYSYRKALRVAESVKSGETCYLGD